VRQQLRAQMGRMLRQREKGKTKRAANKQLPVLQPSVGPLREPGWQPTTQRALRARLVEHLRRHRRRAWGDAACALRLAGSIAARARRHCAAAAARRSGARAQADARRHVSVVAGAGTGARRAA
jgi:hypothetical protein